MINSRGKRVVREAVFFNSTKKTPLAKCQPKGVIRVNQGGVGQPSFQHPDTDTPLE